MIQTSDPDPRSSFPRELIQTIDPDLWNDIMNLRVDAPVIYPVSSQATNCCNQAVKLPSSLVLKLRCSAVQQPSCNCCASKLSSCQADTEAAKQPSCPLAACTPYRPFLAILHPSCNMHKNVDPLLGRSKPIQTRSTPQPVHTTTSSLLKLVIVWFLSFLQAVGSQSIKLTLEGMSTVPRVLTIS